MRPDDGFAASLLVTGGEVIDNAFAAAYATDVPGMLIGPEPLPAIEGLTAQLASLADRL